jgi:hypothetical protein
MLCYQHENTRRRHGFFGFCAKQQALFDEAAWKNAPFPKNELLAAVYFLKHMPWFKPAKEMLQIEQYLNGGNVLAFEEFEALAKRVKFDAGRMDYMIQMEIKLLEQ